MWMQSRLAKSFLFLVVIVPTVSAQSSYQVVTVSDPGIISGVVKWAGPTPSPTLVPINKDTQVCAPEGEKVRDLERLIIGPHGGVANTVVFLKNVSQGKSFNTVAMRRSLDQKHCRYEPHILLVPESGTLQMKSSDAVLHTVHMDGAASFNVPFPFPNKVITRDMPTSGLVNLRCNGGHVWMNGEMFVMPHPYFAVTDENGNFQLTGVPPGTYQIVAWHEGWHMLRQEGAFDYLSGLRVQRPVFSDPKTWEQTVSVHPGESTVINFSLSEK